MNQPWFQACPQCGELVVEIAECDIPADVHAFPIIRDMPIELAACLRCQARHEWYVIAYKTNIRDVVYQTADGRYTRIEKRTLAGDPGRN
jgi:hypothetical protein